nr:lantibiotic dehydratase [Clostridium paraputrificum]
MRYDYILGDYYFIRRPSLNLLTFKNMFIDSEEFKLNNIKEESNYDFIKKAIFLGSNSLYNSIEKKGTYNNQACLSLAKYITRMTTRSTPYGLFAGVQLFKSGDNFNYINSEKYMWNIEPDSGWIKKVVQRLESNFDILIHLKVKMNNNIFITSNELVNLYPKINKSDNNTFIEDSYKRAIYKSTNILKFIDKEAKMFIDFGELYKKILDISSEDIKPIDIFNYLYKLVEKEILITNLQPTLSGIPYLEQIINVLEKNRLADIHYKKLVNIYKRFLSINSSKVSNIGIEFLNDTQIKMKEYVESEEYFNIILNVNEEYHNISYEKIHVLQELLTYLLPYIKEIPENKSINEYKKKYFEKYGKDREVLLLDLINSKGGIGFPNFFEENDQYNSGVYKRISENLFYEISEALYTGRKEIDIREVLPKLKEKDISSDISPSCEVLFINAGKDYSDIREVWLSPIIGTNQAGKTPGRFINSFGEYGVEVLKENARKLEHIYKDNNIEPVQIDINHHKERILNIVSNQSYYNEKLQLGFGDEDTLELNSLIVGIDKEGKFYIRRSDNFKRIQFSSFNNLNSKICPQIYQLLLLLSEEKSPINVLSSLCFILDKVSFHPRIVYKNIVLFPAKYTLNMNERWLKSFELFKSEIRQWILTHTSESILYLKQMDNRLLINFFNNTQIEEVYNQLKKNKTLIFNEVEEPIKRNLDKENTSIYEICLPFYYNNFNRRKNILTNKYDECNDKARTFIPLSNWIYLKIYPILNNNEFISEVFNSIYNEVLRLTNIKNCFYIQYIDENPHIRLRIESKLNFDVELLEYLNRVSCELYNKKIVYKIVIDTYERESERYGGHKLIGYFESFSSLDSKLVAEILKFVIKSDKYSIETIAILSIIDIINIFDIDYSEQEKLFSAPVYRKYNNIYRINRKKILSLVTNRNSICKFKFYEYLEKRNDNLKNYYQKILLDGKEEKINIMLSLIHMHCNRLFGVNREKEREVLFCVRKTLQSLKYI